MQTGDASALGREKSPQGLAEANRGEKVGKLYGANVDSHIGAKDSAI